MINTDEDLFICDMAETYGVFNYRGLPLSLVATLSSGLRNNSRIRMKMDDAKVEFNTLMIAAMVDQLSFLAWTKTKDAEDGMNKPESIVKSILGEKKDSQYETFETEKEFLTEWNRIAGEKNE